LEYVRQCEAEGSALVIRPECKLPISRLTHDPDKMQAVYDIGREEGLARLDEIRNFLNR
jgi:predicted patatin/cPLA2 family phospholipase